MAGTSVNKNSMENLRSCDFIIVMKWVIKLGHVYKQSHVVYAWLDLVEG